MNWLPRYTKTFYRELAKVPEKTRKQIENFAFGEAVIENPFNTSKIEKLTGYSEYYKVRFDSYGVGLGIDQTEKIVEFRRVRYRRDIYRQFP